MQLNLRPFYNILSQQNNFESKTELQKRFEEIKIFSQNKLQTQFQISKCHFMQNATPLVLASVQHYKNSTMEQIKRTSSQQTLDYPLKLNLDSLLL